MAGVICMQGKGSSSMHLDWVFTYSTSPPLYFWPSRKRVRGYLLSTSRERERLEANHPVNTSTPAAIDFYRTKRGRRYFGHLLVPNSFESPICEMQDSELQVRNERWTLTCLFPKMHQLSSRLGISNNLEQHFIFNSRRDGKRNGTFVEFAQWQTQLLKARWIKSLFSNSTNSPCLLWLLKCMSA